MEMKTMCVDRCTDLSCIVVILFISYRINVLGVNKKRSNHLWTKRTSDIAHVMDHSHYSMRYMGTEDQQTNLHFYSNAWLWTTTHLKITNSFHFWFKRKCCVCIKWTQTDDASSFVMQVLPVISGGICCVTQPGVEPSNLWPFLHLFSQHHDYSHAFSFTGWCVGQSHRLSLQYTAGGVLAVLGGLIVCAAHRTECKVHKKHPPKWALSSEHSIGSTFSLKDG